MLAEMMVIPLFVVIAVKPIMIHIRVGEMAGISEGGWWKVTIWIFRVTSKFLSNQGG